jgi:peroxiredoxin family protein
MTHKLLLSLQIIAGLISGYDYYDSYYTQPKDIRDPALESIDEFRARIERDVKVKACEYVAEIMTIQSFL